MRIFITGINGMIGSAIAALHERQGDIVAGIDLRQRDDYLAIHGDIRDSGKLLSIVRSFAPDRIYHCAAMLGVQNTEEYPDVCRQINERGTLNVALAACDVQAELVFLSSSEVYGNQEGLLSEQSPLSGTNVYALSKIAGETYVQECQGSIKTSVVRLFNCFGPQQVRQFFIPKIIEQAIHDQPINLFGDPSNRRAYLSSYDAARFIMDVAGTAEVGNTRIVNVAHPYTATLQEVAEHVVNVSGSNSEIQTITGDTYDDRTAARDVPNRLADTTLLKSISRHEVISLPSAIYLAIKMHHTTLPDWSYERSVV